MIVGEHIAFGMPFVFTFIAEASSLNLVASFALTIGSNNAIFTSVKQIHSASVHYLKIAASALRAFLVSFPVFHNVWSWYGVIIHLLILRVHPPKINPYQSIYELSRKGV